MTPPWWHGRPQAWAGGGTCLPLENIHAIRFSHSILVRPKRTKIVATMHVSSARNNLNCDCERGSALDPAGEVPSSHQRKRKGIMERAEQSGEGGREWNGVMVQERSPYPLIILFTLLVCPSLKKILQAPMLGGVIIIISL